ncbi:MAG: hypothetical protein R3282_02910, partial [Rhodothermales bacterium]|nr:hypothetical protein [Rhodothermales bacterium]
RYVRFMYPSRPPEYWSEENIDTRGRRNIPSDRRFLIASGPFRMEPGDRQEIILAIVYSQLGDRHESAWQLSGAPYSLRTVLPDLMAFDTTSTRSVEPFPQVPVPAAFGLGHHPNPASDIVYFRFELPAAMEARLVLYDAVGREVAVISDGYFEAGRVEMEFPISMLSLGVYIYRLETTAFAAAKKLTVFR